MATRWKGSRLLVEQVEKTLSYDAERLSVTRKYEGPYDVCVASRPRVGSELADMPGVFVDKPRVDRLEGGKGALSIEASGLAPETPETPETETETQATYELDWQELTRPLIQHPIYWYAGGLSGFADGVMFPPSQWPGTKHELTMDDITALALWEDCPDLGIKRGAKYFDDNSKHIPGGGTALSANAKHYAVKRLAGIESFVMRTPVLKLKIQSYEVPLSNPCDLRFTSAQLEDEGFTVIPLLYLPDIPFEWLSTADHVSRTGRRGKYEWNREWTGAQYWDHDLYLEFGGYS